MSPYHKIQIAHEAYFCLHSEHGWQCVYKYLDAIDLSLLLMEVDNYLS